MKPLLVSTYDNYGGAAHAAFRIFEGLRDVGVDPHFLTRYRTKTDANIHVSEPRSVGWLKGLLDFQPTKLYPRRQSHNFNTAFMPDRLLHWASRLKPDLINLHWIGEGFLNIKTLDKVNCPIIWTLHDSWPFTGGCYIPYDCPGHENTCGKCPQLKSTKDRDLSRLVWERKARAWRDREMKIIAPSNWMASAAGSSSLFRNYPIEVIPNGLDIKKFSPVDMAEARQSLGLPAQSILVLFSVVGGVNNWNKGGDLLKASLGEIPDSKRKNLVVLLCGSNQPIPKDFFPVPCIDMGFVTDDNIKKLIYSSVDVTVIPSRSESLGYVAMESMSCGTPCVCYSVGGLPDLVDHQVNGFLAKPYSVVSFAQGVSWVLSNSERRLNLSMNARRKVVTRFCHVEVAKRYKDFFIQTYEETLLSAS